MKKTLLFFGSVLGVFALTGCGHTTSPSENISPEAKEALMSTSLEEKKNVSQDDVFSGASSIELKDVTGGNATGLGWIVVKDGKTHHQVIAENLPSLQGEDFYEGWLVKSPTPGGFFSTGKMLFDAEQKKWLLNYETVGDKSEYNKIVITLEPNDGNPDPAEHIIEN